MGVSIDDEHSKAAPIPLVKDDDRSASNHLVTQAIRAKLRRRFRELTGIDPRNGTLVSVWQRNNNLRDNGIVDRETVATAEAVKRTEAAIPKTFQKLTGVNPKDNMAVGAWQLDHGVTAGLQSIPSGKVDAETVAAAEAVDEGVPPELQLAFRHPDGMLTQPAKSLDGQELPVGTPVRIRAANSAEQLTVEVLSPSSPIHTTHAVIPFSSFQSKPKLNSSSHVGQFQLYRNPLWGPNGPEAKDVDHQGYLSDCYFLAALGAVCSVNPKSIMNLIWPHALYHPYYIIRLHRNGEWHSYSIDRWLPSLKGSDHQLAYAGGKTLWAPLFEEAWAKHKGSYAAAEFGAGYEAMDALTGVRSEITNLNTNPSLHIDNFRRMQKEHQAITFGTRPDPGEIRAAQFGLFQREGNTLIAKLWPPPGVGISPVYISSQSFVAQDDGNGGFVASKGSLKSGEIDYRSGTVRLTFAPGRVPIDPSRLAISWLRRGPLFLKYNLLARHEYRFVGISEPNAIQLSNPMGIYQPLPIDVDDLPSLLFDFASNRVQQSNKGRGRGRGQGQNRDSSNPIK